MNIGSYLSPLLTAATQATSAYQGAQAREGDKQRSDIVQQIAMLRAQHEQEIKDAVSQSTIASNNATALQRSALAGKPDATYDSNRGGIVNLKDNTFSSIPGLPERQTPDQSPLATASGYMNRDGTPILDKSGKPLMPMATAPKEHPDHYTFITTTGPDGKQVVSRANTLTGAIEPTDVAAKAGGAGANGALAAPMAAKVGQAGEMLKKASDLLPAMDALDVHLGGSAAQDIATHGLGVGSLRIPGTQGLGSAMLNNAPDYATYQASLSPFVLAAAHALSGARINDEQVKQIRASIELKPGDTPQVRAQKKKNVIDLMNSINGSLPPDAVAAQEAQMDAPALTTLRNGGYKGAAKATTPQRRSTDVPAPAAVPSYEDWKKAQGIP